MTESTVLDALLGAIIVLVALIGYWQGIVRGLVVISGALIGSELALWWSDETGDSLADVLPFNADTGRFIAATGLILGAALVLGVLLGNQVSRPAAGHRERLGGIGVSLVSALLIIGLVIRYFSIHLAASADDALSDTRLALALWEQFDWIMLISACSGVALIILFWVLGAPEQEARDTNARTMSANAWKSPSRSLTPAAPGADLPPRRPVDRVQPSSNNDHAVYGRNDSAESRDGQHAPAMQPVNSESRDDQAGTAAAAAKSDSELGRTVIDSADRTSAVRMAGSQSSEFDRQYAPVARTLAFSEDDNTIDDLSSAGICPNCGMLLTSGDSFCPDCGHPVD